MRQPDPIPDINIPRRQRQNNHNRHEQNNRANENHEARPYNIRQPDPIPNANPQPRQRQNSIHHDQNNNLTGIDFIDKFRIVFSNDTYFYLFCMGFLSIMAIICFVLSYFFDPK